LASESNTPVLLATVAENKVILANSSSSPFSCGAFIKEYVGTYNGKGGGSDIIAQAGFQTWEEAFAFYEFTVHQVNENLKAETYIAFELGE
ncbi:hypothetical protein AB4Z22_45985, partial [Paenibacillus sp. TAF58]